MRAEAERRYARERREALVTALFPSLVCWAIWAWVLIGGNGTGFPWPIFVMIGTGALGALRLVTTDKEDQIVAIQRRLEKRQNRALGHETPDSREIEQHRRPGPAG